MGKRIQFLNLLASSPHPSKTPAGYSCIGQWKG